MVCESGDVDADDVDPVWDEVLVSKPEQWDEDDKDGAVIPFAAARDEEQGESEIKPFIISFRGEEDADENI
jgi:hypothetical protein